VSKGDVSLKKIGLELVVRVDGHKRTIMLPGALAGFRPASASLASGALVVGFAPDGQPARV
jgi:arsenite-transporting ATPase